MNNDKVKCYLNPIETGCAGNLSTKKEYNEPLIPLEGKIMELVDKKKSGSNLCSVPDEMTDFVENAVFGVYKTNRNGSFIYANKKTARIFGFDSPDAFIEKVPNFEMLYADSDDREKLINMMEKEGAINNSEVELKRPDGRKIWISISARCVVDQNNKKRFEGALLDITDRKKAVQALNESETRFRQLVNQACESFVLQDFEGNIVEFNRQAHLAIGYSREEMEKLNVEDIDTKITKDQHQLKYWKMLKSYEHVTFESRHQRKDGSSFPVEVRLGRIDLKNGPFLLSLARDISERNEKKEALKSAFCEIKELKEQLEKENTYLRKEIELKYRHSRIIGESSSIKEMLSMAEKVGHQNTCVMITGETGTGKELLAHAIHNMSDRNNRPMVIVNCAALPASLIESELKEREKGAFTGALSRRTGRFETADRSTIFLDEIGELPMELQAKLLRVLQEGQFERLGSSQTINVDVRIVAATNCDLKEMIRQKKFRKDLYYRLNVFPLNVPPLRDRKSDIPLLVWAFTNEFAKNMGKKITRVSKSTMERMTDYTWPGNIREMRNIIERAIIMSSGETLEIQELESTDTNDIAADTGATLEDVERTHILSVLKETGWRVSGKKGAALILGLKPTTLEARMKKLSIKRPS